MTGQQTSMLSDEEATLYDRQIRLWGADAQLKLRQTRLLLIHVNSLSIEVCKNLCLAGVAGITVFDNTCVTADEVAENLSLTMSAADVGEFKSACTCRFLQQLNPRVQLTAESSMSVEQIDEKYLEQFDYVCLFNYYDFATVSHLNKLCRGQQRTDENGKKQVHFFYAGTFGLYGFVFKDLGDVYEYLSENSVGSESLIKGEGGNDSKKKSEKVTTKSHRNFTTFENAFNTEWKPNRRQATTRSAVTTYNLLRALLKFHERYHRAPALTAQDADIANLMSILREVSTSSTAAASSSNNTNSEELNEELLKDVLVDNNAVASIVGGIMSHDIVKVISKQEPKDNFFFFNGLSCVGLSIPIAC